MYKLAKEISRSNKAVKPIILYYEMLSGESFINNIPEDARVVSLFSWKQLPFVILSIFISISKFWKNKNLLKNQKIICGHNQYTFSIQLDFLAYENFSYMHIFVYDFLLNSILGLMKRNSSMSLNGLIHLRWLAYSLF